MISDMRSVPCLVCTRQCVCMSELKFRTNYSPNSWRFAVLLVALE